MRLLNVILLSFLGVLIMTLACRLFWGGDPNAMGVWEYVILVPLLITFLVINDRYNRRS